LFREIVFAALVAGVVGGLFLSALQSVRVVPLIYQAEHYEVAANDSHSSAEPARTGHAQDGEVWAPGLSLERFAYTVLANVLMGIGFALLLSAAFTLRSGVGWREGLVWGLGGFAAFNLAPAFGLPPELPGIAADNLEARQIWWFGTVAASSGALLLIAFARPVAFKALGVGLLVLPHLIGAPHVGDLGSKVPAELAAAFVSATLVTNLLFWLVIGGLAGLTRLRLGATRAAGATIIILGLVPNMAG